MRTIVIDEAGTSGAPHERVAVVGALIVDENIELNARAAVERAMQLVPAHYREGFIPHATEIWNKSKYRDRWERMDRLAFLKALISIPREVGIPVAMCLVRSSRHLAPELGFNAIQLRHANCFLYCLGRAEHLIERMYGDEVACVVAEQVGGYERALNLGFELMRTKPMGRFDGSSKISTKIIDEIRFVKKGESPLMPIIDAVVFAWRRWLEAQRGGEEMVECLFPRWTHLGYYLPRSTSGFEVFELIQEELRNNLMFQTLQGQALRWEATGVGAKELERMSSARHPIVVTEPAQQGGEGRP